MTAEWTPEREAELRRMWGEGKSAADIARALGGVTRNAIIGRIHRMGLGRETAAQVSARTRAKAKAKPKAPVQLCAVPGCGDRLHRTNAMGVCGAHKHHPGLCRCPSCQGQVVPVIRRAEPRVRPDVRVAEVPYATSNSGVPSRMPVSLKREPWLQP